MRHSLLLVILICTYPLNHICYIGEKLFILFILFKLFVTKTMQHLDKILQKSLVCLKNRHYISAQILEVKQIPQKRRLIEPHVNAAVINTSIPANEIFFAQIENNVKGRGKTNGNLIVAFRVMQNVNACSTKTLWTTIMANYVARHISAQTLPIGNLFECNSHRKHSADSQIQTENLFVFNSQLKQFVDAQTQRESFHRKN